MPKLSTIGSSGKILYQNNMFHKGMHYTSTELREGYAQAIINFDVAPTGTSARPRGPFKHIPIGSQKLGLNSTYVYNPIQDTKNVYHISFRYTANEEQYKRASYGNGDPAGGISSADLQSSYILTKRGYNDLKTTPTDVTNIIDDVKIWDVPTSTHKYIRILESSYQEVPYLDAIVAFGYIIETHTVMYKGLLMFKWTVDNSGVALIVEKWNPYSPSVSEAVAYGFNLLKESPYEFNNYLGQNATDNNYYIPTINGIIINRKSLDDTGYVTNDQRVVTTVLRGADIRVHPIFALPPVPSSKDYYYSWEMRKTTDMEWVSLYPSYGKWGKAEIWNPPIANDVYKLDLDTKLMDNCYLRLSIVTGGLDLPMPINDEHVDIASKVFWETEIIKIGERFEYIDNVTNYITMREATRLGYFNRHLLMYGDSVGDHLLQFSMFEDLNYMPYPHYAISFQEPIIHVHEHNDKLIVFCRNNIYMLYDGVDPLDLKLTKIYSNLSITDSDRRSVTSIGQDVFFMVGTKAYIIRPNKYKNDNTDVEIIYINESIEELMKDPSEYIRSRLEFHYVTHPGVNKLNVTSEFCVYTLEKKIHIFQSCLVDNQQMMLVYNYDIVKRMWTMYDTIACSFPRCIKVIEPHIGFQMVCANHPTINNLSTVNYIGNSDFEEVSYVSGGTEINKLPEYHFPTKELSILRKDEYTVIDGDTIDTTYGGRIRIIGINCPEINSPWGMAAKQFTSDFLAYAPELFIEDTGILDKYDRLLCHVWSTDQLLSSELLLHGLAEVDMTDNNEYVQILNDSYELRYIRGEDPNFNYSNGTYINPDYIYSFDQDIIGKSIIKNIQSAIYTGNLDIDLQNYKRFERVLVEVTNVDGKRLPVKFDFKVDGKLIQSSKQDKEFPNNDGTVNTHTVTTYESNETIESTTMLDEWNLDVSKLPPLTRIRLDIKTPGRGRVASFYLAISVKGLFDLLNYGIIYKKKSI